MTDTYYLSVEKRQNSNIITVAAQHNLRTLGLAHGPHIDMRLTASNRVLHGPDTVDGVVGMAKRLMQDASVKLAVNNVRMVEVLLSLPASTALTAIEQDAFFEHAVQWVEHYFRVPVLSAVLHRDEENPHVHFLLLPLLDGRMKGSDMIGGPSQLRSMQADFYENVAQHHRLVRKAPEKRYSASCRSFAADAIIKALQSKPALLNDPDMVAAMRVAFGERPEPSLKLLGIDMPQPTRKPKRKAASSFVAQMTRSVKPDGANRMVSDDCNHIGFAPMPARAPMETATMEKSKPYLCVGFGIEPASSQADEQHNAAADVESVRRVRDTDAGPGYWCEVRGEWVSLPAKSSSKLRAILPRHH